MSVRTKILEKGKIVQEQLIRLLIKFDERITALEDGEGSSYDDTEIKADISALETAIGDNSSGLTKKVVDVETAIGDVSTEGSILARIKALEDAQTPDEPANP